MMPAVIGFGTLLVFVLAGLAGPLLGLSPRRFVPVVAGELLAGIVVGPQVLGAVAPTNASVAFLGEVGFAMLMLTAGMHLPLRDPRLASSLRRGAVAAVTVGVLAVPAGLAAAALAGTGHAAIYAVVLASGSAAVLLPAIREAGAAGPTAIRVMAQVTIADIVTIVTVPIVLQPARTSHALEGAVLVAAAALALLMVGRRLAPTRRVQELRLLSKRRHWALDLRLSLLALFLLAWIAQKSGTSTLIAGFGAGVMVALLGGPKRLSTQVRGIADGFFVPLYFVVLGARLDLSDLFSRGSLVLLVASLAVLSVLIRLIAAAITRLPAAGALAASAQLGVPAAVASLGLDEHVLSAGAATAIVGAALVSLAVSTLGIGMIARNQRSTANGGQAAA
jgi:Kef-type K+ transport system membrane component KefB